MNVVRRVTVWKDVSGMLPLAYTFWMVEKRPVISFSSASAETLDVHRAFDGIGRKFR